MVQRACSTLQLLEFFHARERVQIGHDHGPDPAVERLAGVVVVRRGA
jgi:hypothetical protein